jgi:hypothetical protein
MGQCQNVWPSRGGVSEWGLEFAWMRYFTCVRQINNLIDEHGHNFKKRCLLDVKWDKFIFL